MPKIAVYKFFTFFIFAFDALNEPAHIHVVKEKGNRQRSAKIWLETGKISNKGSLNEKELNTVKQLVKRNKEILIDSFNKVKKGEKVKTINLI